MTVAQNCDALPVLSVQPTAVAADIEGGTYSFTYTITNPADDGELTCSSTSSWITDFSVGASSVSFSVAENTGTSMRTGTISVYYTYGNGSLAETVTVVQDHEGGSGGGGGDYSDILGTYTASGLWYVDYDEATERAIVEQTTWTIIISANGSSGIYIQGMTPNISTYYLTESLTFATATVNSFGQIVIPSQMWSVTLQEGYYTGYTPCTEYDEEEGFYYGDGYSYNPDCTFTYDSATDTWESDYGMFVAAYSSTSFSSFAGFFDVVAPTIKLTKVSSSTSAVSTKSVSHPIDEGLKLNVNFKLHK